MAEELRKSAALTALMLSAVALPVLLAYNRPPVPTAFNELLSLAGWGVLTSWVAWRLRNRQLPWRALLPVAAALMLLGVASLSTGLIGSVVTGPALIFAGLVAAATVVIAAAAPSAAGDATQHALAMQAFHRAIVIAGLGNAMVACLQIFAPAVAGGDWIAGAANGRTIGNIRQSNQLATLVLFAAAALPALRDADLIGRKPSWAAMALLMLALVLSGSRTGLLGLAILALWGGVDRRLSRSARTLLMASPVLFGVAWLGVLGWAEVTGNALDAAQRLASADGPSTAERLLGWRMTLELIGLSPWRGVGFGQLNFGLMLTPFAERPSSNILNAHNLPLQLAVELGVPLAVLIVGLLVAALYQAGRRSWRTQGPAAIETRTAFVMLMMVALHSQLEYPLWYAFFLLPTAWALGACLGSMSASREIDPGRMPLATAQRFGAGAASLRWAGLAMVVCSAVALGDYLRLLPIYMGSNSSVPLGQRIATGQRSWFFAHYADYAAVVTARHHSDAPVAFARAPHFVLDAPVLRNWSRALAEQGDLERARHVAQRLGELGTTEALAFFAPCADATTEPTPYQCDPPARAMDWRDF